MVLNINLRTMTDSKSLLLIGVNGEQGFLWKLTESLCSDTHSASDENKAR